MISTTTYREFSSKYWGEYRYSFQGQEKDNEVYGNGNAYTAQFWEYDPRLGRRWNRDPVVKHHRSPYDAFSNNPIIMVDPKGDDDYFNADGTYSHSTPMGSNIYVKVSTKDGDKNVLLNKIPLNNLNNRIIVLNVINHYARVVGMYDGVGLKNIPNDPESKERPHAETRGLKIVVNSTGGKLASKLGHIYNLMSTLKHEKNHQEDNLKGNKFDEKTTFEGAIIHANVYLNQIHDEIFEKTSEEYQEDHFRQYANYLQKAYENREFSMELSPIQASYKIDKMIADFNKGVGKKYGWYIKTTDADNNVKIRAIKIKRK